MNKKLLIAAFALSLLIPMFLTSTVSAANQAKTIPNKSAMIYATIGEPETVDPAWGYDTSSGELCQNVYEPLVSFPREVIPSNPMDFRAVLATSWTISGDLKTYTFTLRDAKFHDGSTLTGADVEYSFERAMVLDHVGGPTWMLYYPLTGLYTSAQINLTNTAEVIALGQLIDNSVTSTATTVTFHLQFAYGPWMQILTQSWSMIMSKSWVLSLAAAGRQHIWDGNWGDYSTWINYDDNILGLSASPLQTAPGGGFAPVEMGTGPYKLVSWTIEEQYTLTKFDDYWQKWPAPGCADYVTTVRHLLVPSWPTRKLYFLSNDPNIQADVVDVPRQYLTEVQAEPGVRHTKNMPTLILSPAGYFNFDIAPTSVYFGVKPTLAGAEKRDLYNDMFLRKAFAHSLNYAQYIIDAYVGEAEVASSAIIRGMNFWNASKPLYTYDLNLAEYYFKMAYGGTDLAPGSFDPDQVTPGTLWNQGFTSPLTYNTGNVMRKTLCEMLKTSIETQISGWGTVPTLTPTPLPWGTIYIPAKNNYELPYFCIGWVSDFADPDNNVFTFWHSQGDSSKFQSLDWTQVQDSDYAPTSGRHLPYTNWEGTTITSLTNAYIDELVVKGALEVPAKRQLIYEELVDAWYALMPTMTPAQATARHWERDWVQGYFYNLCGSGAIGFYFYYLWKSVDANMDGDGKVDSTEVALLNKHWHDPPYLGDYSVLADITYVDRGQFQTREMDGDLYLLPGADGRVNLQDLGLVKSQYLDYVVPNP